MDARELVGPAIFSFAFALFVLPQSDVLHPGSDLITLSLLGCIVYFIAR